MYLLFGNSRKLKKIKEIFLKKDLLVKDTKFNDYLMTMQDPKTIIPPLYLSGIKITELTAKDGYFRFFKEYGELAYLFEPPPKPKVGDTVMVVGGKYKGMELKGIVKEVGNNTCAIETAVLGRLIKITVDFDDVKLLKSELETKLEE